MAFRTRLALLLVSLTLALATALGVLWLALGEVEQGLLEALEGKAAAQARIVRDDVELALELGIPLADIPGTYEYLEGSAEADPDVRFIAIADKEMRRLHYGGIGRRRLDPLLDTEPVRAVAMAVASHPEQPLRAVEVEGFSITPAPLFVDGEHRGFVIVAVQGKQIQEALIERSLGLVPAGLAFLLLLIELILWISASAVEEPWRRLHRLMARFERGQRLLWSERHDRSEIGHASRLFNGILHRLRDRAERLTLRATEAERAVFDPVVARSIRERIDELGEMPLAALTSRPERRPDLRPSDLQPAIVLFVAAAVLGLVPLYWPVASEGWLAPLAGIVAGLALALLVPRAGWLLVAVGLTLAIVPLLGPAIPVPSAALLTGCAVAALAAGWLYLRNTMGWWLVGWLALRGFVGAAVGLLVAVTLILEDRLAILPWLHYAALLLAVLASNREPVVRRHLFAGTAGGSRR